MFQIFLKNGIINNNFFFSSCVQNLNSKSYHHSLKEHSSFLHNVRCKFLIRQVNCVKIFTLIQWDLSKKRKSTLFLSEQLDQYTLRNIISANKSVEIELMK